MMLPKLPEKTLLLHKSKAKDKPSLSDQIAAAEAEQRGNLKVKTNDLEH